MREPQKLFRIIDLVVLSHPARRPTRPIGRWCDLFATSQPVRVTRSIEMTTEGRTIRPTLVLPDRFLLGPADLDNQATYNLSSEMMSIAMELKATTKRVGQDKNKGGKLDKISGRPM